MVVLAGSTHELYGVCVLGESDTESHSLVIDAVKMKNVATAYRRRTLKVADPMLFRTLEAAVRPIHITRASRCRC